MTFFCRGSQLGCSTATLNLYVRCGSGPRMTDQGWPDFAATQGRGRTNAFQELTWATASFGPPRAGQARRSHGEAQATGSCVSPVPLERSNGLRFDPFQVVHTSIFEKPPIFRCGMYSDKTCPWKDLKYSTIFVQNVWLLFVM